MVLSRLRFVALSFSSNGFEFTALHVRSAGKTVITQLSKLKIWKLSDKEKPKTTKYKRENTAETQKKLVSLVFSQCFQKRSTFFRPKTGGGFGRMLQLQSLRRNVLQFEDGMKDCYAYSIFIRKLVPRNCSIMLVIFLNCKRNVFIIDGS